MPSNNPQVELVGITDVGCVRSTNEDCFIIQPLNQTGSELNSGHFMHQITEGDLFLAVSDGMGGAAAGEVASSTALISMRDHVLNKLEEIPKFSEEQLVGFIEEGIQKANNEIFEAAQKNKAQKGMGATLTALYLKKDTAYLFQVGDSRGYLLRDKHFSRITRDQSFVGHLVEMGTITEEQAARHPQRNVILQALGSNEKLKVDVSFIQLCADDLLLLCTDGLYSEIEAKEFQDLVFKLEPKNNLEQLLEGMVQSAKDAGGHDNITAIGIRCNNKFPKAQVGEVPQFNPFPFLKDDNPFGRIFQIHN